jgi:ferredoxin
MANPPGTCIVALREPAWQFSVRAGETLLAAAARAAIRLPSSCRNGTCRTCMCVLIEGEVAYPDGRPGLTAEEMKEGWILPCVARALTDLHIDEPGATALEQTAPRPIATGPRR